MNNKTLNFAIIVMVTTLIVKAIGFVRDAYIGSSFGTGSDGAAYVMAMKITIFIFITIASAFWMAMLPIFSEYKSKKQLEKAHIFSGKIITVGTILSFIGMVLLYQYAEIYTSFIARGFDEKTLLKTIGLVKIMVPALYFILLVHITKAILQAHERFFIFSVSSLPANIIIIAYLAIALSPSIEMLAVLTVVGWVLQFIVQLPELYKDKFKYIPSIKWNTDMTSFTMIMMPILLSTFVYNINSFVDSSLASTLSVDKVPVLNYAYTIYLAVATIIVQSISTVFFPKLVEYNGEEDKSIMGEKIGQIVNMYTYILFPVFAFCLVLAKPLINIIYLRGNFTENDASLTTIAFIIYMFGIIGFGMQETFTKVFFAMKNSFIPTTTAILSVVLNITLNFLLIGSLDYKGLALATSISIFFNGLVLLAIYHFKYSKLNMLSIVLQKAKVLGACISSLVYLYFSNEFIYSIFKLDILVLLINGILGLLIYYFVGKVLKIKEAVVIEKMILSKITRKKVI